MGQGADQCHRMFRANFSDWSPPQPTGTPKVKENMLGSGFLSSFKKKKKILLSLYITKRSKKGRGQTQYLEVQFSSVAQSCLTPCDPMNHSTPGLPVHHQLPEFTQTHVHRVRDAIQPSHPLSSPSPPAPNPSQHQSLFQ